MGWFYLIIAALFEIGWPLGIKLSQTMPSKVFGIAMAVVSMVASMWFLWVAQKYIPIGTAYVVWTGIGAIGTLLIGIIFFGDSVSILRLCSALLILIGVVGLKLAH